VRKLYIGSLANVSAGIFPDCLDYLALGHLHISQKVNGSEVMRYSGSPLPIGFGEAKQIKSTCLVDFINTEISVRLISIPVFQRLERIQGHWDEISARILELAVTQSAVWLDIVYEDEDVINDLRERLETAVSGTEMEVLRVKNNRISVNALGQKHVDESLDDLTVDEVFERCLSIHEVPEGQRPELLRAYQETIRSLEDDDTQAE